MRGLWCATIPDGLTAVGFAHTNTYMEQRAAQRSLAPRWHNSCMQHQIVFRNDFTFRLHGRNVAATLFDVARVTTMTTYTCSGEVWKYDGPASWHFISLPAEVSANIRAMFSVAETGWGRLHVRAAINNVAWDTAIWYDTKRSAYLLPLKAKIRTMCGVDVGMHVKVTLTI